MSYLKSGLQFLDLGVQLPTQGLLILHLPIEGAVLLLLALEYLPHLDLVPLKVGDRLLAPFSYFAFSVSISVRTFGPRS